MDQLDRAKQIEMRQRQQALESQRAKARETEAPDEVGGVRYCLDCGDAIPKARLTARPESVRCVECKGFTEKRGAHYA